MTANQWLLFVGVPSLIAIIYLVWEWHSRRRVRLEKRSCLTVEIPDQLPSPHKLEPPPLHVP